MNTRIYYALGVLILILTAGSVLAPHDPIQINRIAALSPPDGAHWLGTDQYGRDVFSRFLAGGSWSILVGIEATTLVLLLALTAGGLSGFRGGWLDQLLMRLGDLMISLPWLYVLIGLRSILPLDMKPRTAVQAILLAIALVSWARPARLIRGAVLSQMTRGYVDAARGFGVPGWKVFLDHVLPATYGIVGTQALVLFPRFVLAEVTLSFLGLGIGAPEPSWGELMLSLKQPYLLHDQWWRVLPLILMLPVFAISAIAARVAARQWRATR